MKPIQGVITVVTKRDTDEFHERYNDLVGKSANITHLFLMEPMFAVIDEAKTLRTSRVIHIDWINFSGESFKTLRVHTMNSMYEFSVNS